jgi:hypothetical protein
MYAAAFRWYNTPGDERRVSQGGLVMGFLDNLKGTLSQGADRVKFETEKMQRTGRLRNEVGDLQQQIATNFGQLGQRAYELHHQGQITAPEIGSLAQIINDLQSRLGATQQELDRVQNEQFEASQPPAPPQAQAPYAQPYGEQPPAYAPPATPPQGVPTPPEPVDAGMYACPSCGFKLPMGSAFCPECGARVSA